MLYNPVGIHWNYVLTSFQTLKGHLEVNCGQWTICFFVSAFPFQSQLFPLTSLFVVGWLPFPCYAKNQGSEPTVRPSFPPPPQFRGLRFTHSFWESHTWKYTRLLFCLLSHHLYNILPLPLVSPYLSIFQALLISAFLLSSVKHPPCAKTLKCLFYLKKKKKNLSLTPISSLVSCSLVLFLLAFHPVRSFISSLLPIFTWHPHSFIFDLASGLLYI